MPEYTSEGIGRGHHLIAPLSPGSPFRYLFTVTRVHGKHSVEAITNTERMVISANIKTLGILNEDSEIRWVEYQDRRTHEMEVGAIIDRQRKNLKESKERSEEARKIGMAHVAALREERTKEAAMVTRKGAPDDVPL